MLIQKEIRQQVTTARKIIVFVYMCVNNNAKKLSYCN